MAAKVSKFGEYISSSSNVKIKVNADEAWVLAKVPDVSVIPITLLCSCRSPLDLVLRKFMAEVVPIGNCLPVDELAEENMKFFKQGEGGGSNVIA